MDCTNGKGRRQDFVDRCGFSVSRQYNQSSDRWRRAPSNICCDEIPYSTMLRSLHPTSLLLGVFPETQSFAAAWVSGFKLPLVEGLRVRSSEPLHDCQLDVHCQPKQVNTVRYHHYLRRHHHHHHLPHDYPWARLMASPCSGSPEG